MARMLLAAVLLLAASGGASAATLGEARVGFAADRILVFDGQRFVGRIWQMPGVQRHEQPLGGVTPAFILHRDSGIGDVVLSKLHTVVEFALPKAFALLENPGLLRHPLGAETVNGVPATRYAVDEGGPEGHAAGSLWLSRDGIPVKCEGSFTATDGKVWTVRWELRHVRIGRQDPGLFEIPKGFGKLRPEAVAPLLGLRLKPGRGG